MSQPTRSRLMLIGLPLASGAALVAYLTARLPLLNTGIVLAAGGALLWVVVLTQMSPSQRWTVGHRTRAGFIAGLAALAAYDATRFGVVAAASLSFQPFHVFPLFGKALLGPDTAEPLATVAGIAFHATNGIGFAVAFALAIPRPTPMFGIAWALCLEAAMLTLYPGWLGIPLLSELVPVSLAGHVAYGFVLGSVVRKVALDR